MIKGDNSAIRVGDTVTKSRFWVPTAWCGQYAAPFRDNGPSVADRAAQGRRGPVDRGLVGGVAGNGVVSSCRRPTRTG